MIKMVDEKNVTYKEALNKYPDCKLLMINVVDDCRGTITGDLAAISDDLRDFKEFCLLQHKYAANNIDTLQFGDYVDGGAIGVQYEFRG